MIHHRDDRYIPECDTPGCRTYETECDKWECFPLHTTREEALEDIRDREWTCEGDLTFCGHCSSERQCAREGHPGWREMTYPDGRPTLYACRRCSEVRDEEPAGAGV